MSKMTPVELSAALEECLLLVAQGLRPEEALKRFSSGEAELRPLLEIALMMQELKHELPVPLSAQVRSRARLVQAVSRPKPAVRTGWSIFSLRLGMAALVLLLVAVALFTTGLASASALPGDMLYPVKRAVEETRLLFTPDLAQKNEIQEQLDDVRRSEVEKLEQSGRKQQVHFAGFLSQNSQNDWQVNGFKLIITPQQAAELDALRNAYVEVEGEVEGSQILLKSIEVRKTRFYGTIQTLSATEWTVNAQRVLLNAKTRIEGTPVIGASVEINGIRQVDGSWLALEIKLRKTDSSRPTERPEPSKTQRPTDGESRATESQSHTVTSTPKPESTHVVEPTHTPEPTRVTATHSGESTKTKDATRTPEPPHATRTSESHKPSETHKP